MVSTHKINSCISWSLKMNYYESVMVEVRTLIHPFSSVVFIYISVTPINIESICFSTKKN